MISAEAERKILELAKLLPSKKIQIKNIAKIVDVDRATVAAIIRRGAVRERRLTAKQSHQKKIHLQNNRVPEPQGPFVRCQCGRLVQQPCLACWLESRHRAENAGKTLEGG
jgi:hypothetical protein